MSTHEMQPPIASPTTSSAVLRSVYVDATEMLGSVSSLLRSSISDLRTWRLRVWPPRRSSSARSRFPASEREAVDSLLSLGVGCCVQPQAMMNDANTTARDIHRPRVGTTLTYFLTKTSTSVTMFRTLSISPPVSSVILQLYRWGSVDRLPSAEPSQAAL
jgi:hypothetical protein